MDTDEQRFQHRVCETSQDQSKHFWNIKLCYSEPQRNLQFQMDLGKMSGQGCRGPGTRGSWRILINWQELLCFITCCCLYTILLENGKSFPSLYGFVNVISYMNSANQVTKLCRCWLGMGQISQLRFPLSLYLCQKQFLVLFMNYNEFLIYRIKILNVLL